MSLVQTFGTGVGGQRHSEEQKCDEIGIHVALSADRCAGCASGIQNETRPVSAASDSIPQPHEVVLEIRFNLVLDGPQAW